MTDATGPGPTAEQLAEWRRLADSEARLSTRIAWTGEARKAILALLDEVARLRQELHDARTPLAGLTNAVQAAAVLLFGPGWQSRPLPDVLAAMREAVARHGPGVLPRLEAAREALRGLDAKGGG